MGSTTMFAPERLTIIKSYLREHRRVDVHSLSELLSVSEVTIRRDLEKLEGEGYLTRIHGGAVPAEEGPAAGLADLEFDPAAHIPEALAREYDDIATVAALMVRDGDVVALLNGSLMPWLARKLSRRRGLTVLTNHIPVARVVSRQADNRAVLLGGSVDGEEQAVFGSLTLGNLRNYYVNHLFVELDGVGDGLQLTVKSQDKADLIRESFGCADTTTALCPSAIFGRNAFFRLGTPRDLGRIVTSAQVADTYKERLFGAGIKLFTSVHAYEGGT